MLCMFFEIYLTNKLLLQLGLQNLVNTLPSLHFYV